MKEYDIAIIGAGVIGTSLAYILSSFSKLSTVLIDMETMAGIHTSSRNTGVIHRPFYIHPEKKLILAQSSQQSFEMWRELAFRFNLPWSQNGTIEVAKNEKDKNSIENYKIYSERNGMNRNEYEILGRDQIKKIEPKVNADMAFYSKHDSNVSFGAFTSKLSELAAYSGSNILFNAKVISIDDSNGTITYLQNRKVKKISSQVIINVSGGGSLNLAKNAGLASQYSVLHFRGDYWKLKRDNDLRITHNIYSVPQHIKYPFLDPHFIVRPDKSNEIGPNARLVISPYSYKKHDPNKRQGNEDIFSLPLLPKLKLFTNIEFLTMVRDEWKSSTFEREMVKKVRKFIPDIKEEMIEGSGLSGIRHSLIDRNGFVPEVVIEYGAHSIHVLNFNSPGATGSPAFSCYLIRQIVKRGLVKEISLVTDIKKSLPWINSVRKIYDSFQ